MNIINKAVIPIAGYGSRMFPETLLINKAFLPVGNKPVILYLLEELLVANIKDVYFIISPNQANIIDLLKPTSEDLKNKFVKNKEVIYYNKLISSFKFHYTIQNNPNGLARALYLLKSEINEPFALLLGDNIILPKEKGIPLLLEEYKKLKTNIVETINLKEKSTSKYGVVLSSNYNNPIYVESFVEKPNNSSSSYVLIGRYILNHSIFNYIENDLCNNNELLLPDYIIKERTYAINIDATFLDVGTKESFIKANTLISNI